MYRKSGSAACLWQAGCSTSKVRVRMRFKRVAVWLWVVMLAGFAARKGLAAPPDSDTSAIAAADAQILGEGREHSEAMQNQEALSDSIGLRLAGSPLLMQAHEWIVGEMEEV